MPRRWTWTALLFISLLVLASCTVNGLTDNAPPGSPETSGEETPTFTPDLPTPVEEQTQIPIEAVTDLPEHAPTITVEDDPVETTIIEPTPVETSPPDGPSALEALIPPGATFGEAEIIIARPGP